MAGAMLRGLGTPVLLAEGNATASLSVRREAVANNIAGLQAMVAENEVTFHQMGEVVEAHLKRLRPQVPSVQDTPDRVSERTEDVVLGLLVFGFGSLSGRHRRRRSSARLTFKCLKGPG